MEPKWAPNGSQNGGQIRGGEGIESHKMKWKQKRPNGTHSERNGSEKKTKDWQNGAQMVPKWTPNRPQMDPKSSPRGVDERVASSDAKKSFFGCA